MNIKKYILLQGLLSMFMSISTLASAENSLLLGTWELNLDKSSYESSPAPQSQTLIYFMQDGELMLTVKGINADGSSMEFSRNFDASAFNGKTMPAQPNMPWDSMANRLPDPYTYQTVYIKDGNEIGGRTLKFSEDGKSLTIIAKLPQPDGSVINELSFYDRTGS